VIRNASNSIALLTRGGLLNIQLNPIRPDVPAACDNALIQLRGCLLADYGRQFQNLKVGNIFIDQQWINIVEPGPADIFSIPAKAIADLLLFDPSAGTLQRVKVSGQIIHQDQGEYYLADGTKGLRFLSAGSMDAAVGDQVEVAGFPDWSGSSPVLREAVVRRLGPATVIDPRRLPVNDLLNYEYDSTLVQVEGVLVGFTRNPEGEELEMQSGLHRYTAVLKDKSELREPPAIGSQLGLTGVYVGQGGNRVLDQPFNSFQLLLGSRSDIKILARPPWWNLRHSLVMLAATAFGLAGALTWIRTLRRRVELRTHELVQEIAEHERTESQLNEQTGRLEAEIQERNRAQLEVERVHRQLVDASRQAGQAEVAISVLHDVGNVLNSVNVSTSLITDYVRGFRLASLTKVTELLRSHAADLGYFMTADEKGRQLPEFLEKLGEHMHAQQEQLLEELKGLSQNVVHIKEIVTMQQDYAKPSDLSERVELAELVDSALTLQLASYQHDLISVVREFAPLAPVLADRHKVLQILVKLFENARGDFDASRTVGRQVIVRIRPGRDGFACLEVNDNGIGIATENLTRIFAHDFATHNGRHGLGLHSAALAAKEMKGSLLARSEGLGQGATLVLELPLQPPPAKATG
jgi:signal transduction histidine kinase